MRVALDTEDAEHPQVIRIAIIPDLLIRVVITEANRPHVPHESDPPRKGLRRGAVLDVPKYTVGNPRSPTSLNAALTRMGPGRQPANLWRTCISMTWAWRSTFVSTHGRDPTTQ